MAAEDKSLKLCFVTIGATASFQKLIKAVLDLDFISALRNAGYSELRVQHGGDEGQETFDGFISMFGKAESSSKGAFVEDILVTGFPFKHEGLEADMREAKGSFDQYVEGVVVSHAGTGSILDAFRVNAPLVVVPNTSLLDNHQQELADELARQKYVVVGKTGNLSAAISKIEEQRLHRKPWLPVNNQDGLTGSQRFMAVLDEVMGFVD